MLQAPRSLVETDHATVNANAPILLCTVGGSPEPILKAIGSTAPRHVCFFCTDRDPETGKRGSIEMETGGGAVIEVQPGDPKAALSNIPAQAGLNADQYEVRTVPADDLDGAFIAMCEVIVELAERFPGARFIADYTGGTKTMTAALVCAALEGDVDLQLVAGARANLDGVVDGTEQVMMVPLPRLRLERQIRGHLDAWRRFAYREAAEGLAGIVITAGDSGGPRLALARALSLCLARWDDFDHLGALRSINAFEGKVAAVFPWILPTLRQLAKERDTKRAPALLFDLWLNAQRCAARGRFDDAAARWYRLVEWTAQWQIKAQLGFETKEFPVDQLPESVVVKGEAEARVQVGLLNAWKIVAAKCGGPCEAFARQQLGRLRDHIDKRNQSILAHGFRPVSEGDWGELEQWTKSDLLPMLQEHAAEAGVKRRPEQLPTELPKT